MSLGSCSRIADGSPKRSLTTARALDPKLRAAYNDLAVALERGGSIGEALAATGDAGGAVTAFRHALDHRPDWLEVRARLAELDTRASAAGPGAPAR